MATQLTCPYCGNVQRTSADLSPGQSVRCPQCGHAFAVPGGTTPVRAGPRRGRLLPIVLTLCDLAVAAGALFPLAAYVWPGFLRSPAARRTDDPMAFLPPDSNWIVGADLVALRDQGVLEPAVRFLVDPPPGVPIRSLPPEWVGLLRDGDSLLIAGNTTEHPPRPAIALRTAEPVDVERVKQASSAAQGRKVHGHTVYRADPGLHGAKGWLTIPGDHLVIYSEMSETAFADLIAGAGKQPPHPALDLIGEAKLAGPVWGAALMDARMWEKLSEKPPAGMAAILSALQPARGAAAGVSFPRDPPSVKAMANIHFTKEDDAAKFAAVGKLSLAAVGLFGGGNPALLALVGKGMTIEPKGQRTVVSVQVPEETLRLLASGPR
jgi:hypothetical protein